MLKKLYVGGFLFLAIFVLGNSIMQLGDVVSHVIIKEVHSSSRPTKIEKPIPKDFNKKYENDRH